MPTAANTTNWSTVLKNLWKDDFQELYYGDSPLLGMLPKRTDFVGNTFYVPIQFGQVAGISADFSTARTNASAPKFDQFGISNVADLFGVFQVDHKLIQLSKNDKGSIVRALEAHSKSTMKKLKRVQCALLYGNGGGSIGRLTSSVNVNSNAMTFTSRRALRYIDIGDKLEFSSADGATGTLRSGQATVTAIDPESNAITVAGTNAAGNVSGLAVSDYVFLQNIHGNTSSLVVMKGLETYVPASASDVGTLWGLDRTKDKQKLGGVRVGGKGRLIHEAVQNAIRAVSDFGGKTTHIFLSTKDFLDLTLALGTQAQRTTETAQSVGYSGIEFAGPSSSRVKAFPDPDCPENIVWGLNLESWCLHSAGDFPDFLMFDRKFEVMDSSNALEGRIGGYPQLWCDAPGYNFRLDLTATATY